MSYEECEKICAEAVIFINKRLVRLIDVTVEQWMNLKYDHETMNKNVKKGVIGTWLIKSYKLQFEEYLEIKRQRETHAQEVDMEYNPSNLVLPEWLASKFYNHLEMDWFTKNALWVYWMRGNDEVVLSNREVSDLKDEINNDEHEIAEVFRIETNLFDYEIPLCAKFNKFNYLLKADNRLWEEPTPVEHYYVPFLFKSGVGPSSLNHLFLISAATILQSFSASLHISNINYMYIKSYGFRLFSSLPAIYFGVVSPLATRKVHVHGQIFGYDVLDLAGKKLTTLVKYQSSGILAH
ncbi:hypothetical protein Tco_0862041 [Tanacetum coccineum]